MMETFDLNSKDIDNTLDEDKQKQLIEEAEDEKEEAEALDIDEPIDEEGLYDDIEDRIMLFHENMEKDGIPNITFL
jgi:hypothetical protein